MISASFLKIKGSWTLVGAKNQREREGGQIEELVGSPNPGPEAPRWSKKGPERREQRKCHWMSDCQRSDVEG